MDKGYANKDWIEKHFKFTNDVMASEKTPHIRILDVKLWQVKLGRD